jgi:hypothetical protein
MRSIHDPCLLIFIIFIPKDMIQPDTRNDQTTQVLFLPSTRIIHQKVTQLLQNAQLSFHNSRILYPLSTAGISDNIDIQFPIVLNSAIIIIITFMVDDNFHDISDFVICSR